MTNTATLKVYDNYEISPCRRFEEPDSPGRFYFEVCEPAEADVWTLYGHIEGEGVEAIGDFASRKDAEEVYFRITGQSFTGSYEADTRLRQMHAAPAQAIILDLVRQGLMTLEEGEAEFDDVMYWFDHRQPDWCVSVVDAIGWETARAALAQATAA